MSVKDVLARVGEIRARMELAPMRALVPMPAAVATARTGQVPDASFQATLENVQNQALAGTVPVAPTNPLSFYPGAGYLAHDADLGTKMATQAVQYVGTPYVAGGNSPSTGWDCAAMTEWVAEQHGVNIPPVSWEQIKVGEQIGSLSEARVGDLVFFHEPSGHRHDPSPLKVNHVGLYLGDGKMVEAANPSAGTRISDVDVNKLVGIRRLAGPVGA